MIAVRERLGSIHRGWYALAFAAVAGAVATVVSVLAVVAYLKAEA